jgi:hypothetical protein
LGDIARRTILGKAVEKRGIAPKMRVHMDMDRRLWRRFKARVVEQGDTLKDRIRKLIERDLEDPEPDPATTS